MTSTTPLTNTEESEDTDSQLPMTELRYFVSDMGVTGRLEGHQNQIMRTKKETKKATTHLMKINLHSSSSVAAVSTRGALLASAKLLPLL